MATLGQAYVQIIPSAKGISGSIGKLMEGESVSAGESSGSLLGSNLIGKVKGLIAAAGIGKAFAAAIHEGAALEQSLGGVETLFKNSADTVKNYAKNSFQTTGLSANAYMENVTAFSASLISSLGGDTKAAAELANTAMVDMSDNANKMGTDMNTITQTYQSLARGNYAMLDNLKLGYGGTKSEMERLMADAEKLTGEHYTVGDFGDEVKAIHAIQENLGITGTTALEASTTISGSFNSMKAAAQDFLGTLTMGGDLKGAISNLISSAATFLFDNLLPAIGRVIMQIPPAVATLIVESAPKIVDALTGWTEAMHENGGKMAAKIGQGIKEHLPDVVRALLDIAAAVVNLLGELAFQLIAAGGNLIIHLAQGIGGKIGSVLSAMGNVIKGAIGKVTGSVGQFLSGGAKLVASIVTGILGRIGSIGSAMKSLVSRAMSSFSGNWGSLGTRIIQGIVNGISSGAHRIVSAMRNLASNALSAAKKALHIGSPSKLFADEVGRFIPEGVAVGIGQNMSSVKDAVGTLNETAQSELRTSFGVEVGSAYQGIRTTAMDVSASADQRTAGALSELQEALTNRMDRYFPGFANSRIVLDGKAVGKQIAPEVDRQLGRTAVLAERGV